MAKYAESSEVPIQSTQAEILRELGRRGITSSGMMQIDGRYTVLFSRDGLTYHFSLPTVDESEFAYTPAGRSRSDADRQRFAAAEERRRWRALLLLVKAKLVAVDDGISAFEREFMQNIWMGDRDFGDQMLPQIKKAALGGQIPSTLSLPGG